MSEATISFLVAIATIAFAVIGFAATVEMISRAGADGAHTQRHLVSIFLIAGIYIVSSLLPLALEGETYAWFISFAVMTLLSVSYFAYLLMELAIFRVPIRYPGISAPLYIISALGLIALAIELINRGGKDLWIYKIVLLWGMVILIVRLVLMIRYLVEQRHTP
jgi:hypothetical protein